jgi:hypothetical protein
VHRALLHLWTALFCRRGSRNVPGRSDRGRDAPGASPKAQLKFGAQLAAGSTVFLSRSWVSRSLWVLHCALSALVMVCMGIGLGSRGRRKQAAEVLLALRTPRTEGRRCCCGRAYGPAYENYKSESGAAVSPEFSAQVQMILARYCPCTRLNCLSQYLSMSITDELLVETVAGLAGESSGADLTRGAESLPPRHSFRRLPPRCGDDSTFPARLLSGGHRALHRRDWNRAGPAGCRAERATARAGPNPGERGECCFG